MTCELCGSDQSVLEHHVLYSDQVERYAVTGPFADALRDGTFDTQRVDGELVFGEIIMNLCKDCHHKLHDWKVEFGHDELNPVSGGSSWVELISDLYRDYEIRAGQTYKLKLKPVMLQEI